MSNPETNNRSFTFQKLSPGNTIDILTWQARNPKSRLVLLWEDEKNKRTLVSLTVNPSLARFHGQGNLSLRDIYYLIRSANKILVKELPSVSVSNLIK